jgi:hypothetical protein
MVHSTVHPGHTGYITGYRFFIERDQKHRQGGTNWEDAWSVEPTPSSSRKTAKMTRRVYHIG